MKSHHSEKWHSVKEWAKAILLLAIVSVLVFFVGLNHYRDDFTSKTDVNLFPSTGEKKLDISGVKTSIPTFGSKNYRVSADIEVLREYNGFFGIRHTSVWINTVHWPNGGSSHFDKECLLQEVERNDCTASDGTVYRVEVVNPATYNL